MKALKNISDELWLGLMFILSSVWLFALKPEYLVVSGAFLFVGIFLIVVDAVRKNGKDNNNQKSKKEVKAKTK